MTAILFALLFIIIVAGHIDVPATAEHADHRPKPYPIHFQIHFVTNLTSDGEGTAVSGRLSYDWTLHAQRIDHGAGAYECKLFYDTEGPCSLIFNNKGMYRILSHSGTPCCLDLPHIGPPPPDWASNGTYNGVVHDVVSGLDADEWIFDNVDISIDAEFHTCRQVAHGGHEGKPLAFTFPGKARGRQDYYFDVESMVVERQDPALFTLANGCADLLCEDHFQEVER